MPDNSKRVESWELLNLAFMDRADALELADRAAAQTRQEQFNAECEKKWREFDAADSLAYAMIGAAVQKFGVMARDFRKAAYLTQSGFNSFGVSLGSEMSGLNFERFRYLIATLPYRQALREISAEVNMLAHNYYVGMPNTQSTRRMIRLKRRQYAHEIKAHGIFSRPLRYVRLTK